MSRAISQDETPFLQFATSHITGNHFSSGIADSFITVPTFAENCLRQRVARHFQMRRVERNIGSLVPQ